MSNREVTCRNQAISLMGTAQTLPSMSDMEIYRQHTDLRSPKLAALI